MAQALSTTATITRLLSILRPFHAGTLTPGYAMSVLPGRLAPNSTTLVTFTGVATHWLTLPPTWSYSGVSGITTGSVTILDDTHFTISVITTSGLGTLTWTDSRYNITATQKVGRRNNAGEIVSIWRRRFRR